MKAKRALGTYGSDVVVANILEKRYREVVLIDSSNTETLTCDGPEPIEIKLCQALASRHHDRATSNKFCASVYNEVTNAREPCT